MRASAWCPMQERAAPPPKRNQLYSFMMPVQEWAALFRASRRRGCVADASVRRVIRKAVFNLRLMIFQWKSIDKSSFHVWWYGPLSFFVHYMKSSFEELLRDLQIISKELFLSSWNLVSTTNLNTAFKKAAHRTIEFPNQFLQTYRRVRPMPAAGSHLQHLQNPAFS